MESSKKAPKTLKVFLVDDDQLTLDLYTRILREKGYFTFRVSSAADAMEMIDRNLTKVDLIITDVNMPGLNGIQFHGIIQERRPDLADKMIFISGESFSGERAGFFDRIPNPKLNKPVEIDQLLQAVLKLSS